MTIKSLLLTFSAASLALSTASLSAHDMVPGKAADQAVLLKGATVHTVTMGTKSNHDIVVKDGKITAMGSNLAAPEGARVVDLSGKHVYPGLIGMSTTLGLVEIGAVRATRDQSETGRATPEVEAHVAFNADSDVIPTIRANGLTHVEIAPTGRGLTGQASVVHLDGWNWQDSLVKANSGMHLYWPRQSINKSFWERRSVEEQKKDNAKALAQLTETFELIKAYDKARAFDSDSPIDVRWEAMRPVLAGAMPLYIHANDYRQMEQAIEFGQKHDLKIVLVGGADAPLALDLLKESKVPLVFTSAWGQPRRSDQAYDYAYQTPALLETNGIPYALAIEGSWNIRDLPFAAGQSVAHGASKEMALRSVTIEPAKILGLDEVAGSIEVGKQANLVVSEGDIFDHLTHKVTMMMIEGREVDLNSRHKQLYDKYSQKPSK